MNTVACKVLAFTSRMYSMKVPCKDCPDRSPECHGKCERYQEYCAEREAIKARKREADNADIYLFSKIKKLGKAKKKRRKD